MISFKNCQAHHFTLFSPDFRDQQKPKLTQDRSNISLSEIG